MARVKVFDEEEVLDKALHLFWQKGYNGTSAQDLVDGLGISRSSLYATYGDKFQLFKRALSKYRADFSGAMIAMVTQSVNYDETISALFNYILSDAIQAQPPRGCFMVNTAVELAAHNDEISTLIAENGQDIEDALADFLRKGQEAGHFTTKFPPRTLARFVFNTISGLRVASKSGVDKAAFDEIVGITLATLKQA